MTRIEFEVLEALVARAGKAMSRRHIIDTVWGKDWVGDEQLVDVHIGHLRHKLGDAASTPRFIHTVRGMGYRMDIDAAISPPMVSR